MSGQFFTAPGFEVCSVEDFVLNDTEVEDVSVPAEVYAKVSYLKNIQVHWAKIWGTDMFHQFHIKGFFYCIIQQWIDKL